MIPRYSLDQALGFFHLALRRAHPDVLQRVGQRSEDVVDVFEAVRQSAMNVILDRVAIAQIEDVDRIRLLSDTLNASLALFQTRWVPRQVDIDQGLQPLQV